MSANKHPYHLVDPSPWPVMGAGSALLLFGGAVMFMHEIGGGTWIMALGGMHDAGAVSGLTCGARPACACR